MIKLAHPSVGKEELYAIRSVLESGQLAPGKENIKIQRAFAEYTGAKSAITTSSCSAAIITALKTIGVGTGDEVIVPSFTFPSAANAIVFCGASPVFVDITLDTYAIDAEKIEKAITEKTKAIIPIHPFGQAAEIERIMEIAKKHDLKVIEDAACAVGAMRNGKHVGTFGDFGCFSFHPRKIMTCGIGGMLITNNEEYAQKATRIKDQGSEIFYKGKNCFLENGTNFELSDIAAAILLVQLEKLPKLIQKRRLLALQYQRELWSSKCQEYYTIPNVASDYHNIKHTFQSFVILLKKNRNYSIKRALLSDGVETQVGGYAAHLEAAFVRFAHGDLKNSEIAHEYALALPMHQDLSAEDLAAVAVSLKSAVVMPEPDYMENIRAGC